MRGKIQNYFPGGNTPEGFYSYYSYIIGQKEADSIICIKGGPGTGKSSFMKAIADYFIDKGEDVAYFWCSSDPDSLDGILLKDRRIAFIDGTSPHITDPLNPGAVDCVLNLGDYWDEEKLRDCKDGIMNSNSIIKMWFSFAYDYLRSAVSLRSSLQRVYENAVIPGEIYKFTDDIVKKVFGVKPILLTVGHRKKYFATAITSSGLISHMDSLTKPFETLFLLNAPTGFSTDRILRILSENAVHRGYSVEEFYCPMDPENTMEHLLIPEMKTGFITLNAYHDMECRTHGKIIEMREFIDWNKIEKYASLICDIEEKSSKLIDMAVNCLKEAKREHDVLEGYYIPNMNFEKIGKLADEWIAKIEYKRL